jgi:hypothetical protein
MKNLTKAEDVYYKSIGCGCCTDSDATEWPDVEKAMREEIAQEIEAQIESLSLGDGSFKSGMIGAAAIARGKK